MIKIFKLISNIIFITIIVVLLGYFIMRVTNKVEIYNVKTGSMEDKIHVGDYILIVRKKEYQVGDVVTFIRNEGFITHRIVKMEGNRVTTKGDANNTIDEDIPKDNILGKVIIVGGLLNIIINYKFIIAGFLLSLYLISCYIGDGKDEPKDDKLEEQKENVENTTEEKQEVVDEDNSDVSLDKKDDEEISLVIEDATDESTKVDETNEIKNDITEINDEVEELKEESKEMDETVEKTDSSETIEEVPNKKSKK